MTWEMLFVFGLLAVTFAMMVWEKLSLDIVAMLALSALLAAGILTPAEAFKVFSNEAAITVACMFILSAALERTGVIETIAHRLNRAVGKSDWSLLIVMLPIVAVLSAFINNTPVVVVFMPIMISLAASRGLKPSKLLIPLSFASIFGGLCTLIGTSTNILVSSTAQQLGQPPLGMFELGRAGWILAVVGLVYLLTIGRKLLPNRDTLASTLQTIDSKQYLTEVLVAAGSPLVGKKLSETPLANQPMARVLEVIRVGALVYTPLNEIVLAPGDRLRLTTPLASVLELNKLKGVELLPKSALGVELIGAQKAIVAECVVGPRSNLIGRSVRDVDFRRTLRRAGVGGPPAEREFEPGFRRRKTALRRHAPGRGAGGGTEPIARAPGFSPAAGRAGNRQAPAETGAGRRCHRTRRGPGDDEYPADCGAGRDGRRGSGHHRLHRRGRSL